MQTETFSAPTSFGWAYLVVDLLALAGFAASYWAPFPGFVLAAMAALAAVGENTGRLPLVTPLLPKGRSQNVIGRLAAAGSPRRRVVLVSHLDSTRSGPMFHPRLARHFRASFILLVVCLWAASLLLLGASLPGLHRVLWPLAGLPELAIAYAAVQLAVRELHGRVVHGANDNASGVGVVMALAERLARQPPLDTELWVVGTGCEESGLHGMHHLLRQHLDELRHASLINVDNVGAGSLCYLASEGMLERWKSAPELVAAAERAARKVRVPVSAADYRVAPTDSTAALLRGVPSICVIALQQGVPVNWHRPTDTIERLDRETLEAAQSFVGALLGEITGGSSGAEP